MNFAFEYHDATIFAAVHNQCVAGVKLDRLAIPGEASDQIGSSSNRDRPIREVVAGLEHRFFGKRFEIMLAIN
jgi:hypothetical protein